MYGQMFQAAMQWQTATLSTMQMSMAAATVIQYRVMQMVLGVMKPEEAARMVLEKPSAFMRATEMSARALAGNKGIAAAAVAGITPIRKATQTNAKRLTGSPSRRKR